MVGDHNDQEERNKVGVRIFHIKKMYSTPLHNVITLISCHELMVKIVFHNHRNRKAFNGHQQQPARYSVIFALHAIKLGKTTTVKTCCLDSDSFDHPSRVLGVVECCSHHVFNHARLAIKTAILIVLTSLIAAVLNTLSCNFWMDQFCPCKNYSRLLVGVHGYRWVCR